MAPTRAQSTRVADDPTPLNGTTDSPSTLGSTPSTRHTYRLSSSIARGSPRSPTSPFSDLPSDPFGSRTNSRTISSRATPPAASRPSSPMPILFVRARPTLKPGRACADAPRRVTEAEAPVTWEGTFSKPGARSFDLMSLTKGGFHADGMD